MKKSNTKNEILEAALDLFSVNGYEATSMSEIADKVGIKKASLYAHFSCKEEILSMLIETIDSAYQKNSIFTHSESIDVSDYNTSKKLVKAVTNQVSYILHDPYVSKVRKLLTIEQYRNEKLAALQQKHSYDNVMNFGVNLIGCLVNNNILVGDDLNLMAAEFVFPISMWVGLCDRNPEKEKEVMKLIEKHVIQFYKIYKK